MHYEMPAARSSLGSTRKRATRRRSTSRTSQRRRNTGSRSTALSQRTKKQIDTLPEHAKHIYKQAHANALEQYSSPSKRLGGRSQSREQVAHKVAWSAVKKEYEKKGSE